MANKKIEIVELNKKEEKIILKENQSKWKCFWKKYNKLILIILIIIALTTLLTSLFIAISNLQSSEKLIIKQVSIDTDLDVTTADVTANPSVPLTDETAKKIFKNNTVFKNKGEVLLVKTIEKEEYTIKFYSDYTAVKYTKSSNVITRINSIDKKTYGINESGVTNSQAKTTDVEKTNTKDYPWGTVIYYSDGSAEIVNSNIDMYVRDANEIQDNYISNNKVSYFKETKTIGNIKLNYYYDGTIEIIKNKKSYLIRNEEDLEIKNNNISFKYDNEATIKESKKLSDGKIIHYYTDGGAIIQDGENKISVRKSNSIIIEDNKIFEIVDNIYVTVCKTLNKGNVIYYTNGSAVIKNYNGKTIYVEENSDIKYKENGKFVDIINNYEKLTEKRNIDSDKISTFETISIVETDEYIAIVPKGNVLYDTDGSLKAILTDDTDSDDKPIKITNNTNDTIKYRIVIEKSKKTTVDVKYIKYQLSVGNDYKEPTVLNSNIWKKDVISDSLSVTGINYILLEKTLKPQETDEIRLMLWTDYDTIPNSMQNKYFYGTIRIYAWQEIELNI